MNDGLMGFDPTLFCGLIAAGLSVCAFVPYIKNTLYNCTRPHKASWLIWTVLASISLASQIQEGAEVSLGFAGAQWAGTLAVFVLSVKKGYGTYLTLQDVGVLIAAATGIALWFVTDSAVYALLISITVSSLGGLITIRKAYAAPKSETKATWSMSLVASLFAIVSVGALDWILLAYPLYLLALNSGILLAMHLSSARKITTVYAAE
ncbi:hypothetical protein [Nereida sp. MMG025]|uniref:hypothetical protein n=1 Tax=Nereida sp. MMG025 TaxID=2909981 RepID=UPI001F3E8E80|nr:hypothetical protein [Nereida sp. MMG025]MCF6444277.1 hypothetical protein [Nereida sp. MMG025]